MSVSDETTTVSDGILLSDAAASKVKALLEQEGRDDLALRVAVQPGGCSGLRYQLFFDERSLDGDVVKDFGGVKVVTDRMSAPYLGRAGRRSSGLPCPASAATSPPAPIRSATPPGA
ncbi:iron-sulfur cluster assembly accessory protein, partial [Streptomyces sp. NPDC006682]|uniref:HesB/IscA family protein n=1 Tax=Streptomyces sp. NPDC006682 TaxID=3156904 RepID=UPI003453A371